MRKKQIETYVITKRELIKGVYKKVEIIKELNIKFQFLNNKETKNVTFCYSSEWTEINSIDIERKAIINYIKNYNNEKLFT